MSPQIGNHEEYYYSSAFYMASISIPIWQLTKRVGQTRGQKELQLLALGEHKCTTLRDHSYRKSIAINEHSQDECLRVPNVRSHRRAPDVGLAHSTPRLTGTPYASA